MEEKCEYVVKPLFVDLSQTEIIQNETNVIFENHNDKDLDAFLRSPGVDDNNSLEGAEAFAGSSELKFQITK